MDQVTLHDETTRTTAEILTGFGCNCFRFATELDGREVSVIWSDSDFASCRERPSGSGIPILFPFPGRIRGTNFQWQGRTYPLDEGDGRGNAIHGFVHARPWRVLEHSAMHVVAQFHAAADAEELLDRWPSDFRITTTYRLEGRRLVSQFVVENPGGAPLPFGLGTHPYFRLPLVPGADAASCRIQLPVSSEWELRDMNATGRRLPVADLSSVREGRAFGDLQLDHVFGDMVYDEPSDLIEASLVDPQGPVRVSVRFDRSFEACVVYTPGHREAICIEPYTCVPDAFRLSTEGIRHTGLRVLSPGDRFEAQVRYEVARPDGR